MVQVCLCYGCGHCWTSRKTKEQYQCSHCKSRDIGVAPSLRAFKELVEQNYLDSLFASENYMDQATYIFRQTAENIMKVAEQVDLTEHGITLEPGEEGTLRFTIQSPGETGLGGIIEPATQVGEEHNSTSSPSHIPSVPDPAPIGLSPYEERIFEEYQKYGRSEYEDQANLNWLVGRTSSRPNTVKARQYGKELLTKFKTLLNESD